MMKTKFLLSAIVLPLAFAACTSEDVIEAGNGQIANIEGRAALADITFVAEGVDSRLTTDGNGKWTWEDTDKFSAHLIDGATKWSADTALVTNYIYSKTAEGYTTTSQMVEGLYWFFAPANEDKVDREMMKFELPVEQTYDEEDPAATLLAQNVWFSPVYKMEAKNNAENVTVPLTMYNWYATALMAFKNNGTETLDIEKIIVQTENALVIKGKINPKTIQGKFYKVYDEDENEWVDYTNANGDVLSETPMEENYTAAAEATNNVFILNCPKTLDAGDTFTAKMLMPYGNAGEIIVYVVLEDGSSIKVEQGSDVVFNHHAQKSIFGVNNNKAVVKNITSKNAKDYALNYVQNNDDVLTLLNSNSEDIKMNKVGDWALNAKVIEEISEYAGTVTFETGNALELEADTDEDEIVTLKNLKNAFTLKSGLLKIDDYAYDITVEDGELTLIGDDYAKIIINGGKVTLNKANANIEAVNNNKGELVIAKNATVRGNENVSAIQSLTIGTDEGKTTQTNGIVTINSGVEVDAYMLELPKGSTLNVNGTLDIIGSADKKLKGTVNVAGIVTDNRGKLVNEGTINISGTGSVAVNENNGVVNMEANTARVTITDGKGKVKNTNLAYVKANANQAVYYEVTASVNNKGLKELDETISGYGINTLKFAAPVNLNGELQSDLTGITNLVFSTGSSLTLANKTLIGVNVENIYVEGDVIFAGYAKDASGLGFKKNAEIYVAAGKKLTVNHMTLAPIESGNTLDVILMNSVNATTGYITWGQLNNEYGDVAVGTTGKVKGLSTAAGATASECDLVEAGESTNGNGKWEVLAKCWDVETGALK